MPASSWQMDKSRLKVNNLSQTLMRYPQLRCTNGPSLFNRRISNHSKGETCGIRTDQYSRLLRSTVRSPRWPELSKDPVTCLLWQRKLLFLQLVNLCNEFNTPPHAIPRMLTSCSSDGWRAAKSSGYPSIPYRSSHLTQSRGSHSITAEMATSHSTVRSMTANGRAK